MRIVKPDQLITDYEQVILGNDLPYVDHGCNVKRFRFF